MIPNSQQVWDSLQKHKIGEKTKVQLTERERKGIAAIIHLQGMAGIKEAETKALAGWRGMSQHEQDFTLEFCDKMKQ